MPLSSYKAYLGGAKLTIYGTAASSIASAATSVSMTASVGTPSGTGTLTIVDGSLTESVAVSAVSGSGPYTLTVGATSNAHSANVFLFFQATAGPSFYIPVEQFKPVDVYDQLEDKSARGSLVEAWSYVQGVRTGTLDFSGAVFSDTFGNLLKGMFGAEDYTAGSPDSHVFSVDNSTSAAPSPQPPTYAFYSYDAFNTRVYVGRFTELTLTLDPKQLLKYSAKMLTRASGVVSNPTPSFTAIKPLAAWLGVATVGGTALSKVMTAEITFARTEVEAIPTLSGIQDPYDIFVGALTAKGKYSAVTEDDVQLNYYINNTQPTLQITATTGTGASQQEVQVPCNVANFLTGDVVPQGKSFIVNDLTFEGVANTTDATTAGGGSSPAKVTLLNATASAY